MKVGIFFNYTELNDIFEITAMDKLIIIGNGFDLAHGLPTKYSDFITDYWSSISGAPYEDEFIKITPLNSEIIKFANCRSIIDALKHLQVPYYYNSGHYKAGNQHNLIECRSKFFNVINELHVNSTWVDIEVEYFKSLKKLLPPRTVSYDEAYYANQIHQFNIEIRDLINAFDCYLHKHVVGEVSSVASIKFDHFFDKIRGTYSGDTTVLNFNYTDTIKSYFKGYNTKFISIHGSVKDEKNPINLGFGDERDGMYHELESFNSNELLRYTKSSFYANNTNYEELEKSLSRPSYEVHIVGHSCGLSDRTLLSRIFEDKKCKRIYIHYYKYRTPTEFGEHDNYLDTYRNIMRHFNDKSEMRRKVMNRSYSFEIPQV